MAVENFSVRSSGASCLGGVSPPRSEPNRSDTKTTRVAIAIFVSLVSYYFLPKNIAIVVTVCAFIWALADRSDREVPAPTRRQPWLSPPPLGSSNTIVIVQNPNIQKPSPDVSGPNIVIINADSPSLNPGISMSSSSSVFPPSSSTLQSPPPGTKPHPSQVFESGTASKMSSTFSETVSSSQFAPPAGAKPHPDDVLPSSQPQASHFAVGGTTNSKTSSTFSSTIYPSLSPSTSTSSHFPVGGASSVKGSTFGPGIQSSSSSTYSSTSPAPFPSLSSPSHYPVGGSHSRNASTFGVGIVSSTPSSLSPAPSFTPPAGSKPHPGSSQRSSTGNFQVGKG